MHKDIAEMAAFAKSNGMQTSITTNCLLYPKVAKALAGKINLLHSLSILQILKNMIKIREFVVSNRLWTVFR